jgi:peptidoglycan/xylan/chitin deacetylase (PgdA/CDA1 family)
MADTHGFHWPRNQRAAVTLTYDDALPVHWQHVGPELESAGLRGTFNVMPHATFDKHVEQWREMAARGHELGNHLLDQHDPLGTGFLLR